MGSAKRRIFGGNDGGVAFANILATFATFATNMAPLACVGKKFLGGISRKTYFPREW
jgi:hypothetical protein